MDKTYGQNLWTKLIFVPFLIADISLSLGNVCADCCECCNECWGEKILEGEKWNKAVSSFSGDFINDNFFENKYQNFNIFYDSVINKIKKKQFDAIRELYNKKVQYIKKKLKLKEFKFNIKAECGQCTENKDCVQINDANFCEKCIAIYQSNLLNTLKLPVCIPRFTLLKKDKYFVLKVSVLAIYVDESGNLFIRGDWSDEATYSDKFFVDNQEHFIGVNQENKLFKRISEDDENFNNIYIYNYQKTNKSELKKKNGFNITNKSHLYFVLGEKDEKTIFYNKEFNFVNCLNETSNMNVFKQQMNVLNQTQDLYTSFAFCFHAVFYIIYSSLLYQIDPVCNNNSRKICPNTLHYYFNYGKEESHACIVELLENKNLASINVVNEYNSKSNETIKAFVNYFKALYGRMLHLPDENFDENCYAEIRNNSFTYSTKLLESIITGFENPEFENSEYAPAQ